MHNSSRTLEILETTLDSEPVPVVQVELGVDEAVMLNIKLLARSVGNTVKAWNLTFVAKHTDAPTMFDCACNEPIGDAVPWNVQVVYSSDRPALLVLLSGSDQEVKWTGQLDYLKLSSKD